MDDPKLCPDCGFPLVKRSVNGRYFCDNPDPECPMIYGVAPHRGEGQEGFTRITRAAVPVGPTVSSPNENKMRK